MVKLLQIRKLLFILLLFCINMEAFQLDLEGSLIHKYSEYEENKTSLDKASIRIKKAIADDEGDRLHLFLKAEVVDNLQYGHIDLLYAKYKGPMGRWNVAVGRSLMPFGLLTDYDTEMLILKTQQKKTIGYKNDDGVKVSGFWKSMDYEILASPGKWMKNHNKYTDDKMISLKISFKGLELEDPKLGLSFLSGKFKGVQKDLYALDIIKYHDLLVSRNEFVFGKHGEADIKSLFSGIDYSVLPSVDLNVAYSHFISDSKVTNNDYEENSVFLGVSYNSPFYGLTFRAGNKYNINNKKGDNKNEALFQIYKSFSTFL